MYKSCFKLHNYMPNYFLDTIVDINVTQKLAFVQMIGEVCIYECCMLRIQNRISFVLLISCKSLIKDKPKFDSGSQ